MARMKFNRSKFRRELRKLGREIEKEAKRMKIEIPVGFVAKPESEGNSTLKAKATKVLQALHDRVNGSTTKSADLREISKELGYSEEEFDAIWMYLHRKNWIKGFLGGHALITVDGIEYLEQKDNEQKDNEPPVRPLIQQNMYVYGGQNNIAQAGEHAEVNYISNDSSRQLIDASLQLIDELKKDTSVKPEDRTEAIDLVETVKVQAETHGEPKPGIVRSTLRKLNEIGSYVDNGSALYNLIKGFINLLPPV
jgi:hypothetical protein